MTTDQPHRDDSSKTERRGGIPDSVAFASELARVTGALTRIEAKLTDGWRVPVAVAVTSGALALAGTWLGSRLVPGQQAATVFAQEAAAFYTRSTDLVRGIGDGIDGLCRFGSRAPQARYDALNGKLDSLYVAIHNHRGKVRTDVIETLVGYNTVAAETLVTLHSPHTSQAERQACDSVRASRGVTETKLEGAIANIGGPL